MSAAAEVNLATEVATVRFDPTQVGLDELTAAVTRAGYTATPTPRVAGPPNRPTERRRPTTAEITTRDAS